ncbi:hypothetical protein CGLAR1_09800 [Corynebacterium glutamicum]|uniref:hypothetical protein n=1 Tax=Corynebacterium glutamicum TaxID=1718 RepID=UPI0004F88CBD|nr:hypothetical protein [Corynebacterium glutamicum]AIK85533.1 hypothetical protein CGLAR1_09800 [Corynebacterium glutamicum]AIK88318.1 hypothetical protein AR0_09950 [Corynebacterium glutamicum]
MKSHNKGLKRSWKILKHFGLCTVLAKRRLGFTYLEGSRGHALQALPAAVYEHLHPEHDNLHRPRLHLLGRLSRLYALLLPVATPMPSLNLGTKTRNL